MEGLLMLFTAVAVVWLVRWTMRDKTRPSREWWPFEMADPPGPPAEEIRTDRPNPPPWRRRD
jgi:hypothetical protein